MSQFLSITTGAGPGYEDKLPMHSDASFSIYLWPGKKPALIHPKYFFSYFTDGNQSSTICSIPKKKLQNEISIPDCKFLDSMHLSSLKH